jgi:hypothetical protein
MATINASRRRHESFRPGGRGECSGSARLTVSQTIDIARPLPRTAHPRSFFGAAGAMTCTDFVDLARCWSPAMSSFIAVAIAKKLAIVSIRRDEWIRLPAQMV